MGFSAILSSLNQDQLEKICGVTTKMVADPTVSSMDTMMVIYGPLVVRTARRLKARLPRQVDVEDLEQDGFIGLRNAIHRFDRSRNVKFSTFAAFHIRGAMLDSLRDKIWEPRLVIERSRLVDAATRRFVLIHGRKPSVEELADSLGISGAQFEAVLKDSHRVRQTPLSRPRMGDDRGHGEPAAQQQADNKAPDPIKQAQARDLFELITRGFTRAQRLIVLLYYYENMTMKEIGATLDLSESRVCQMHANIIARLKAQLHGSKEFFDAMRISTKRAPRAEDPGET